MIVVNYLLLSTKWKIAFFICSWENLEEILWGIFLFLILFQKNDVFIQLFMFFMFRIFKIFVSFWKIRFRKILCKISRNACMFMFKSRIPELINQVSDSGHMSDRIGHIEGHSNWNKSVLVVSIITYVLS